MTRALLLLALALAGCKALLNKDFTGGPAPALDGGTWVGGKEPREEWRVVTFFEPGRARCVERVPRLAALRRRDVAVVAVTRASVEEAARFAKEHGVTYAILADGAMAFERWGIGSVDHAPVYVVDPNGRVLAEGFDDCAEVLRERLGPP